MLDDQVCCKHKQFRNVNRGPSLRTYLHRPFACLDSGDALPDCPLRQECEEPFSEYSKTVWRALHNVSQTGVLINYVASFFYVKLFTREVFTREGKVFPFLIIPKYVSYKRTVRPIFFMTNPELAETKRGCRHPIGAQQPKIRLLNI